MDLFFGAVWFFLGEAILFRIVGQKEPQCAGKQILQAHWDRLSSA